MKLLSDKKTIFLVPALLWLLSQSFVLRPRLFFITVTLGILLIIFAVKGLSVGSKKRDWPLFFYFPALLFASSSLYVTLLPNYYWLQALVALNTYLVFHYFKNFYYFFRYGAPDREEKLDNLSMLGSFLSVFFLAASIYGLPVFLGWHFWPLLALFSILTLPLFFQAFVVGKLDLKNNWPFFLASAIILLELAGVLYLLPLGFNILGLIAAILYYLLLIILRLNLRRAFSGRVLRFPLISSAIVIIILLLTTRWL